MNALTAACGTLHTDGSLLNDWAIVVSSRPRDGAGTD